MAKAAAVLVALLLLTAWGWFAWQGYKHKTDAAFVADEDIEYSLAGAANYVAGLEVPNPSSIVKPPLREILVEQVNVRIALGTLVAFIATLFYSVCVPSGSIFSINLACFVVFFTGAANMVFPLVLLARTAYAANTMGDYPYHLGEYGLLLYCVVALVACFTALRNLGQMRSGKAGATAAVVKCLLTVLIVTAALAPTGEMPTFSLAGLHGLYWLSGLCAFSLLLIALTKENYRFD